MRTRSLIFVLASLTATGCNDRVVEPPIEWPEPVDIAQNRLNHACVVVADGLKCWAPRPGIDEPTEDELLFLQRDIYEPGPPLPFVELGTGTIVSASTESVYVRCVLLASKGVKCWGKNNFFDLGVPDTKTVIGDEPGERGSNMPYVDLGPNHEVVALSNARCALFESGRAKCWGVGGATRGLGDVEVRGDDPGEMGEDLPYIDLGSNVHAIGMDSTGGHVCVWTAEGRVKCWGDNSRGQLGFTSQDDAVGDEPGEMGDALPYVDLGSDVFVVQVSAGQLHTCALTDAGRIKCWGANSTIAPPDPPAPAGTPSQLGRLGIGEPGDRVAPLGDALPYVDLGDDVRAVAVDASSFVTCAVLEDGRLKCWGYGNQLGYGDPEDRGDEPGEMGDALPYLDLGQGRTARAIKHPCIMLDDDSIKCMGPAEDSITSPPPADVEPIVTHEDLYGPSN